EPRISGNSGQEKLGAILLVIPVLCPLIIPATGLQCSPLAACGYSLVKISLVVRSEIEPHASPAQFIGITAPGLVVLGSISNAVRICSTVLIRELIQLLRMLKQLSRIGGV